MNAKSLNDHLTRGCTGGLTAIRSRTRLQPAGGKGDKVLPPTYSDSTYAEEARTIDGISVNTILLDSVQSVANRFEEALLEDWRSGHLPLPVFEVNVAGHEVNSLTAPHRIHDAIFRDSLWSGTPFRESPVGRRLVAARAWNATAFFEYAPTVLLFGTWDSQSGSGTNSAKIARCLVSEIIALDAVRGVKTSSRIDPLGIRLIPDAIELVGQGSWRYIEPSPEGGKKPGGKTKGVRPSEINHGNVTPTITDPANGPGGITFREALQTTVLSFAQLRKLRFPVEDGDRSGTERDVAGRAVVAALGLHAAALFQEGGYQLRSRCQLIPAEAPKFELIGRTEGDREDFELTTEVTRGALDNALTAAREHNLRWHCETVRLEPKEDLVKLVQRSDKAVAIPDQE